MLLDGAQTQMCKTEMDGLLGIMYAFMANPGGPKEERCTRLQKDIAEGMLLHIIQGNMGSYMISEAVLLLI